MVVEVEGEERSTFEDCILLDIGGEIKASERRNKCKDFTVMVGEFRILTPLKCSQVFYRDLGLSESRARSHQENLRYLKNEKRKEKVLSVQEEAEPFPENVTL